MKTIQVSNDAFSRIENLRKYGDYESQKSLIADAFTTLSDMINVGRNCEEVSFLTNDLLNVMYVLGLFNDLLNVLDEEKDDDSGCYIYQNLEAGKEETA